MSLGDCLYNHRIVSVILMWQYYYREGESVRLQGVAQHCRISLATSIAGGMQLVARLEALIVSAIPPFMLYLDI